MEVNIAAHRGDVSQCLSMHHALTLTPHGGESGRVEYARARAPAKEEHSLPGEWERSPECVPRYDDLCPTLASADLMICAPRLQARPCNEE